MNVLNLSKIKSLRKQKGWEQKELAAKANVNPAVISRLERGLQEDFKVSVIVGISLALGIPIDALLEEKFQFSQQEMTPELQSASDRLSTQSPAIQNRIAALIEAYLTAIEKEL